MGTALIVEDHPEQADLVARILRLRDYEPILAEDGETGLRLAREQHPDVMLLDLMLPDINGFDVCRRLRTDPATVLIPVVMLTALNDVQHRVHGFRVGANAYVTKPYGVDDLFEAIAAARAWRTSMEQRAAPGRDPRRAQQRDQPAEGPQRLPHAGLPVDAAAARPGHAAPPGGHGDGPQRHRVGQPPPDRSPGEHHLSRPRRPPGDRGRDQGPGFDRSQLPHAAVADDPFTHLDVREKLGLRAGGFGLLICQGMVDEMRYNDAGNEVTLIKRFPAA